MAARAPAHPATPEDLSQILSPEELVQLLAELIKLARTAPDRHPLATQEELAEFLGVEVSTVEKWRVRQEGPEFIRVGRLPRYRWAAVEKWLKKQTVQTF